MTSEKVIENDFWAWASSCLSALLFKTESQGFNSVDKNLFFDGNEFNFDLVDKINIGLVSSAIDNKDQIAIILPDDNRSHPMMVLATSLLIQWFNSVRNSKRSQTVVYLGSPSILRTYFNKSYIRFGKLKIPINKLLPQIRIDGHGLENEENNIFWEAHIPKVICTHLSCDPSSVLEKYNPDWIVIDYEDGGKRNHWIKSTLAYAINKETPVISWNSNPLSECVRTFNTNNSLVFSWSRNHENIKLQSVNDTLEPLMLENYFKMDYDIILRPIMISAPYEREFARAYELLTKAWGIEKGQLERDAFKVGWIYFRTLETLHIPLNMYEVESRNFYGMTRVTSARRAYLGFIEAINRSNPEISEYLQQINGYLENVYISLQNNDPSMWLALNTLCNTDMEENNQEGDNYRIILFISNARKQLFSWALLARFNITEEDLNNSNISLTCLKTFREELKKITSSGGLANYSLNPILVGLPGASLTPKLDALLMQKKLDIMMYDYQYRSFLYRVKQWNDVFSTRLHNNANILSKYGSDTSFKWTIHEPHLSEMQQPINVDPSILIASQQGLKRSVSAPTSLLKPINPVDEISLLIMEEDEMSVLGNVYEDEMPIFSDDSSELTLDKAIEIRFEDNSVVLFAPDELIKIICDNPSGDKLDERYVRSLREGDRVLFIHGLKRQNLYDLILARIHKHPAIEVHLALIMRWHEDFRKAVQRERRLYGMTMSELLEDMQDNGSNLSSVQTLNNWLDGSVLCPEDPDDLWRLADALCMDFVMQNYKRIYKASHRLRGIHVGLSRKLNNWLLKQAEGIIEDDECMYDLIDEELDLTLQDFRDALTILRVKNIKEKQGIFCRENLGNLIKEV